MLHFIIAVLSRGLVENDYTSRFSVMYGADILVLALHHPILPLAPFLTLILNLRPSLNSSLISQPHLPLTLGLTLNLQILPRLQEYILQGLGLVVGYVQE